MNVCSLWPFAQISDDFYYLDIWQYARYFVAALFKELALITIRETWGLGLELPGLGLGFYDKVSVSSRHLSQVSEVTVSTTSLHRCVFAERISKTRRNSIVFVLKKIYTRLARYGVVFLFPITWSVKKSSPARVSSVASPKIWEGPKILGVQNVWFQTNKAILFGLPPFKARSDYLFWKCGGSPVSAPIPRARCAVFVLQQNFSSTHWSSLLSSVARIWDLQQRAAAACRSLVFRRNFPALYFRRVLGHAAVPDQQSREQRLVPGCRGQRLQAALRPATCLPLAQYRRRRSALWSRPPVHLPAADLRGQAYPVGRRRQPAVLRSHVSAERALRVRIQVVQHGHGTESALVLGRSVLALLLRVRLASVPGDERRIQPLPDGGGRVRFLDTVPFLHHQRHSSLGAEAESALPVVHLRAVGVILQLRLQLQISKRCLMALSFAAELKQLLASYAFSGRTCLSKIVVRTQSWSSGACFGIGTSVKILTLAL